MKTKEKVAQGKGTADHLMPLGYLLLMHYRRMDGRTDRRTKPLIELLFATKNRSLVDDEVGIFYGQIFPLLAKQR